MQRFLRPSPVVGADRWTSTLFPTRRRTHAQSRRKKLASHPSPSLPPGDAIPPAAPESASSKHKPEALDIGRKSMQERNTYSSICYTQELMNKGKRTQDLKKKPSQDQETCRNHRSCGQRCREVIMPCKSFQFGIVHASIKFVF